MEPGAPGGEEKTDFVGLDNPPADRSDQPGRSFTLNTDSLGSIYEGAPVYFRGVEVGEVLGYQMNSGFAPIAVRIFIRDPYGDFVRAGSQFWNASGVSLRFGPEGVNFATHSLRTVLAGGISFSTPASAESDPPAASDSKFTLYDSQQDADLAQSNDGVAYAAYFRSSVRGLEVGAPVLIYGIQVGKVTDVKLALASPHKGEKSGDNKIRVAFAVKPARVFGKPQDGDTDPVRMVHDMIDKGMRAKLDSSNLLTGQRTLTLEFTPNAQVTTVASEDGVVILPTDNRGTDNVMEALGDVANKLNQIPFDQIGNNLNHLIASADQTVSGQDMQQAVHSLAVTLANAEEISKEANKNMVPALHKLPDIAAQLQEAATHANELMASLDNSYSAGSDFQRSAKRALDQVNEAARSVRLLADFLERHPEALLTGKSAPKDQR
jgi:paraquat-inducible protein B